MTEQKDDFYWLNEASKHMLSGGYLESGVDAKQRVRYVCDKAEEILGIPGFSDKLFNYKAQGFYSWASPIWSNFGTDRGMPISCFGSNISDNTGSILFTASEIGAMSKIGGGTSAYFGNLRSRGSKIGHDNGVSNGSVSFMKYLESTTDTISQGGVRRGRVTPYLPIDHGDFYEFMRNIGVDGASIHNVTHGLTVTDDFMNRLMSGDEDANERWAKVVDVRRQIGFPYIVYIDTANRDTVDVYKDKGYEIVASNLCSEIMLPSDDLESFVCCLSSMNLARYDEWKDTDAVETMVYFLDAVLTDFLNRLETIDDSNLRMFMDRAKRFAERHRAIGIGTLGWHTYLQQNMLPFDSTRAYELNVETHKTIEDRAWAASAQMAEEYGEPEALKGYGRRHTTLTAIAPTRSSSVIAGGVSQSIEPLTSNVFPRDTAKGLIMVRSENLVDLLESKGRNTSGVWDSIKQADGSVQHLPFLTEHEKNVFKTYAEIDQNVIIEQAAMRQPFVDQSQSLNITILPSTPIRDINKLYIKAWKMGIKSLYYQYSKSAAVQAMSKLKDCPTCEA